MPRHVFDIPPDKAMDVAQRLAHRVSVRHGVNMLQQKIQGGDNPDLLFIMGQSNERTQQIIDDILNEDINK